MANDTLASKKDLIVTSGGINIAPQVVEQLLRRGAFIGDAMVYGSARSRLRAAHAAS